MTINSLRTSATPSKAFIQILKKPAPAASRAIALGVVRPASKSDRASFAWTHALAEICEVISVSAGMRGLQILLAPQDYIRAVKARVGAIVKTK